MSYDTRTVHAPIAGLTWFEGRVEMRRAELEFTVRALCRADPGFHTESGVRGCLSILGASRFGRGIASQGASVRAKIKASHDEEAP